MTYKVSFIPYVEVQLTNLLYNSIIGHDLLYGNSYAWSEEEKKGSGFMGHLGAQMIQRKQPLNQETVDLSYLKD